MPTAPRNRTRLVPLAIAWIALTSGVPTTTAAAREIESVAYLLAEYRSGDERKREQMARRLRRRDEPASLPALAEVSRDPAAAVRLQAVLELLHRCNREREIGAIGRDALRNALADADERVHGPVVRSFGCLEHPPDVARDALSPFLEHPSSVVRADAARALGTVDGPDSVTLLMHRLDAEPDEIPRAQVVRSLAMHEAAAAVVVPRLLPLSNDPSLQIRRAALTALAAIAPGEPDLHGVMLAAAEDPDPLTRRIGARALAAYPSPETLRTLGAMAAGDRHTRKEARAAVQRILDAHADDPAILAASVETGTRSERQHALDRLRRLGPAAAPALPALHRTLESDDALTRRSAYDIVLSIEQDIAQRHAILRRGFRDEHGGIRQLVATEFAALGDDELLAVVREHAERGQMRRAVHEAMNTNRASAVRVLRRYRNDPRATPHGRRRAAALLRIAEIEHLLAEGDLADARRAIEADDPLVKEAGIVRLGRLGRTQSVPEHVLVAFLDDNDPWIRTAAIGALGTLGSRDDAVHTRLVGYVLDPDETPIVRNIALRAIEHLDPPRGRTLRQELGDDLLRELLTTGATPVAERGAAAAHPVR